jgi:hypothetical protein
MIGSEKVVYESAFECGADRLAFCGPVHFVNISKNQAPSMANILSTNRQPSLS